jgi:hypothetical protein
MINDNDHCHTLDRENMKAQLECGFKDSQDFKLEDEFKKVEEEINCIVSKYLQLNKRFSCG